MELAKTLLGDTAVPVYAASLAETARQVDSRIVFRQIHAYSNWLDKCLSKTALTKTHHFAKIVKKDLPYMICCYYEIKDGIALSMASEELYLL